jgi:2-polyprenyl-3-methyl-5-hydroxy-6-metoxy-1,4-benzoquinol methylase
MAHHTDSEVSAAVTSVRQDRFGEWPADGLERVPACPLCGSRARSVLHAGLRDYAFRIAPGDWELQRCGECECAYLDPRPDAATIARAYARYYTHGDGTQDPVLVRFGRGIASAYLNHRYGTAYPDALAGGQYLAALVPRIAVSLDAGYARHLGPPSSEDARLLDVGCGNGAFLQLAAQMGWSAEGIDFDEVAVAAARAAGCNAIQGNLENLPFAKGRYRHVTLSHVIEHARDPLALLGQCFELLAPGGRLWLETPNLRSFGHGVFGASWRGLEPPRHLVLFDRRSLAGALARAGFTGVEFRAHPGVTVFMWEQSRMIARASGRSAPGLRNRLLASRPGMVAAELYETLRSDESEFLTCVAFRPGEGNPVGP